MIPAFSDQAIRIMEMKGRGESCLMEVLVTWADMSTKHNCGMLFDVLDEIGRSKQAALIRKFNCKKNPVFVPHAHPHQRPHTQTDRQVDRQTDRRTNCLWSSSKKQHCQS